MVDFSEQELNDELKILFQAEAVRLESLFGPSSGIRAFGLETIDSVDVSSLPDKVLQLPIAAVIRTLYRYVVDARWDGSLDADLLDALHEADEFVVTASASPTYGLFVGVEPPICSWLYRAALARWKLDTGEEDLTIKEIACLANLDERTVRNAASGSENAPGFLSTAKDGGAVCVRTKDARDWLATKRGFKPTIYAEGSPLASPGTSGKYALIELTEGNINNYHFYLTDVLFLFEENVIGGPNRQSEGEPVTVHWGGDRPTQSDIAGDKKIFRQRGWVREFFDRHGLRAGDRIVLERTGDHEYHVYPSRGVSTRKPS